MVVGRVYFTVTKWLAVLVIWPFLAKVLLITHKSHQKSGIRSSRVLSRNKDRKCRLVGCCWDVDVERWLGVFWGNVRGPLVDGSGELCGGRKIIKLFRDLVGDGSTTNWRDWKKVGWKMELVVRTASKIFTPWNHRWGLETIQLSVSVDNSRQWTT